MRIHGTKSDQTNPVNITTRVEKMVSVCTDAVMSAIYAKLFYLNNGHTNYCSHFATAPTYAKNIELPLPYFEAVQLLGSFETRALVKNYLYVPIYPENVEIEGWTTEDWCTNQYDGLIPKLCARRNSNEECGPPRKGRICLVNLQSGNGARSL